MKLHKKNWTVLFTIFCAVLCLHMFARAAQPTSRNVINIDSHIVAASMAYQSGEDWIPIDENTSNIPADARLKVIVSYDNVDADDLLQHDRTLSYKIPDLFQDTSVATNTIYDAERNKIGDITVDKETKQIYLTFTEEFLEKDEEEHIKVSGNFTYYTSANQDEVKKKPTQEVLIGNTTIHLNFESDSNARLGNLQIFKSEPSYIEENGEPYLIYTLTATTTDDAMPEVKIVDTFTANQSYVDSYVGVTGTETQVAAGETTAHTPYETDTSKQSTVYLGAAVTNDNPIPQPAGSSAQNPGVMVWNIGGMDAHETRTLTYRVKLKPEYIGIQSRGTITNQASAYSKTYPHGTASAVFTPKTNAQIKKTLGSYQADGTGGGTLTYQIYVKADSSNTYTLKNLKIHDNLAATDSSLYPYIEYVADSFKLYKGNTADESKSMDFPANKHTGKSNPDITNSDTEQKMDAYIGDVEPGGERVLTYKMHVKPEMFTSTNNEIKIKNTAAVYSDDTVNGGNSRFASSSQEKSLGKKVWNRKLQSSATTYEKKITVPDNELIYNTQLQVDSSAAHNFSVPKGSFEYHVVVNEDGNWDLSSAIFNDVLKNYYLKYAGYLKIAYYKEGLATQPSTDTEAANQLQKKTPDSVKWIDIHGLSSFTLSPKDLGQNEKGAYLLTYYATPEGTDNVTQVTSGNSFGLSGTGIGPNGEQVVIAGVNVSTSTVIEGGKNFEASKSGWYYDYTNKGTKDSINGRLYWVIEVSGNEIPKGTVFRDVPSTSKGSAHRMRRESMVNGGVFVGKVPNGKSFTEYYGSISDVKSDSAMRKLSGNELNGVAAPANADYSWSATNEQADFTMQKTLSLKEGERMYIVFWTGPVYSIGNRDARTFWNELYTKDSSSSDFVSHGDTSMTVAGAGNDFKETGGVYNFDGTQWKTQNSIGGNSASKLLQNQITEGGSYIDWRIKLNYIGGMEGTVQVEDQLPEGVDLTYVRYFWIDESIRNNEGAPRTEKIPELENNPDWKRMELTGNLDRANKTRYTCISYYNAKTRQIRMQVSNLRKGGDKDKRSLEVQVVARVTDEAVLLDNQSKKLVNTMTVRNESGKMISTGSAVASVGHTTISKSKADIVDGKLPFTITVNALSEDLIKDSDTITLVDEMKSPLRFDPSSIQITDKNGAVVTNLSPKIETTSTGEKMTLTIPDNQKYTITYKATLNAPPDTPISVNNAAYWFGHNNKIAKIENTTVQYHVESTASTQNSPVLKVEKLDKDNTTKTLAHAVFTVQKAVYDTANQQWKAESSSAVHTAETDDTGFAVFGKDETLEYNTVYCLKETKAPDGYVLDSTPKYIAIAKKVGTVGQETYPEKLNTWASQGVDVYYLSSIYSYTMYNQKGSITLDKSFLFSNGQTIPNGKTPNLTCSFALYEYKGGSYDYSKAKKLQTLEITSKDGVLSYRNNGASVEKPVFTKLPVGGQFCVLELDQAGKPLKNRATGTLANGTQYTVTYENAGEALTVQGTKETVAKIQNRFRMELILKKINAQGETLPGAVFEIWNGDNLHGTYAVQADGTVNISDLADGEYTIKEKQAPSGYKKRKDSVTIRVADGQISYAESNTGSTYDWLLGQPNQEKNSCVLTVTNEQLKWLPTAGGRGLLPLTLLSGALIGAGAWILVRMKRSK